jgi:hypothetical protein
LLYAIQPAPTQHRPRPQQQQPAGYLATTTLKKNSNFHEKFLPAPIQSPYQIKILGFC